MYGLYVAWEITSLGTAHVQPRALSANTVTGLVTTIVFASPSVSHAQPRATLMHTQVGANHSNESYQLCTQFPFHI